MTSFRYHPSLLLQQLIGHIRHPSNIERDYTRPSIPVGENHWEGTKIIIKKIEENSLDEKFVRF